MKSANNKGSKGSGNKPEAARKDRRSGSGMAGSPKKGGHGGKFTWAGEGYSPAELGGKDVVDVNDPNFEEPEPAAAAAAATTQ